MQFTLHAAQICSQPFCHLTKKLQTFVEQMILQNRKDRDPLNSTGVTEHRSTRIFLSCTRIDDVRSFSGVGESTHWTVKIITVLEETVLLKS
jgi:hypothetical protein